MQNKPPGLRDLFEPLSDDNFILMFLRGCKFSLERTKEKLDMWHTVRTHCPDIFQGWDYKDPKISELVQLGYVIAFGFMPNGAK